MITESFDLLVVIIHYQIKISKFLINLLSLNLKVIKQANISILLVFFLQWIRWLVLGLSITKEIGLFSHLLDNSISVIQKILELKHLIHIQDLLSIIHRLQISMGILFLKLYFLTFHINKDVQNRVLLLLLSLLLFSIWILFGLLLLSMSKAGIKYYR